MHHSVIIYFDIAAVVIMLISLASLYLRKPAKDAPNRVYFAALTLVTLTAIMALAGECYDSLIIPYQAQQGRDMSEVAQIARSGLAMMYYLLRSLMAPAYLVLIATISDTTPRLDDSMPVRMLLWVPMVAVALFVLTNPFHHLVFTFENGVLVRGLGMQVLYVEAAFYSVIGVIWLIVWRKLFSPNEFATLVMLYPIMLAVTIIQYYVQGLRLEMFVTSIVMMLISAFVIHPETRHNALVNAASLSSYRDMVERAFVSGKCLCLAYVEIINMEKLRELVGKVEMQELIRGHDQSRLQSLGQSPAPTQILLSSPMEMRTCIVRIPEDINDLNTSKNFGTCLSRLVPESTVTTYEELCKKDGFDLQMALTDVVARGLRAATSEERGLLCRKRLMCRDPRCEKRPFLAENPSIRVAEAGDAVYRVGNS